jgi:hypothetical protein
VKPHRSIVAIGLAFVMTFLFVGIRPTQAMPPFAQAYGMSCEVCHTAVPALNAYGRYVQRTGYASLDPATIHRANPIWIGETLAYNAQDPAMPHQIQTGNLALHATGFIGTDITFHAQQWITQANQSGGTDTLWVTFNNLFHRDGHLFVGKILDAVPSPYSQWSELSGFATLGMSSGEHTWQTGANRWGARFAYTHKSLVAETAYVGPGGNLNNIGDFSNMTDKSFDWRLAWAPPDAPFELGVYGSQGVFPISDGTFDKYHGEAVYAQMDPMGRMPGLFTAYQVGHDPNAGAGLGASTPKAFTVDAYEPFFKQRVMVGLRQDYNDDGFGTHSHSTNADLEWLAVRQVGDRNVTGLMFNAEALMSPGTGPDWKYQLWYVTTIGPLK